LRKLAKKSGATVRLPHDGVPHKLRYRPSNARKTRVRERFVQFVTMSITANGRRLGKTHWLHMKFTSIAAAGLTAMSLHNFFCEFISPDRVGRSWVRYSFKTLFPFCSLRPKYSDYCDVCYKLQLAIDVADKVLPLDQQTRLENRDD
jgi:hypothetical protein